jgi:hypothetical protein
MPEQEGGSAGRRRAGSCVAGLEGDHMWIGRDITGYLGLLRKVTARRHRQNLVMSGGLTEVERKLLDRFHLIRVTSRCPVGLA